MKEQSPQEFLKEVWWVILLRGILILMFGFVALSWPGLTLVTLVKLFALYVVAAGSVALILGLMGIGKNKAWYLDIIKGFIAIGLGLFALNHSDFTMVFFAVLFGIYAIVDGIVDLADLYMFRKNLDHKFLLGLSGVVSILFGIIVIANPLIAPVVYVWVLGLMALIMGPIWIVMAFTARSYAKHAPVVKSTSTAQKTSTKSKSKKKE